MARYSTFEAFKRNLFSKTKKDRAITEKIQKLERQLKSNKTVFQYGKIKFTSKEKAEKYLSNIKATREKTAKERFTEIQAKHEVERINRRILKGKKLTTLEKKLQKKFPKGLLGKKGFYKGAKISYQTILSQINLNLFNDVGGDIIAIGWASGDEELRYLGGEIYELIKTGELKYDDFLIIDNKLKEESSTQRLKSAYILSLKKILKEIIEKYNDTGDFDE